MPLSKPASCHQSYRRATLEMLDSRLLSGLCVRANGLYDSIRLLAGHAEGGGHLEALEELLEEVLHLAVE